MAKTAQEQILDVVGARLGNIKTVNEYSCTLSPNTIKRSKIQPYQSGDIPVVFYWGENDALIEQHGKYETRSVHIGVGIFDETVDIPFSDRGYQLGADVKTAINRDTAAPKISDVISPELGGLVTQVSIDDIVPINGEGQSPFCGALVVVQVRYKVATLDSFTILN